MNRFLGKLTGWQITAIICAAILAPSGLYAAATFSNVALVNPVTGTPALIDGAGSLHNVDILAQFANNPLYKVTIEFPLVVPTGCQSAAYAIPAGKALVITAISGNYYEVDAGVPVSGLAFYASANCTGNNYGKHYTPMTGVAGAVLDISYQYGSGIAIPAGSLSVVSYNNSGWLYIHGYLVPANLVTAGAHQSPAAGLPGGQGPSAL